MPPHPAGSWVRLGGQLARRRVEIDPRYKNRTLFAEERGMNWRLLHDIERAKRTNFEPETLAAIEVAYELAPGAIARALDGADLEPASASESAPASELAAVPEGDREAVAEVLSLLTDKYEREIAEMTNIPLERRFELIRLLRHAREEEESRNHGTGRQRQ